MKLGGIRKALLAASPLVVMAGSYLGLEGATPEWWEGVVAAVAPLAVWYFANNEDKII